MVGGEEGGEGHETGFFGHQEEEEQRGSFPLLVHFRSVSSSEFWFFFPGRNSPDSLFSLSFAATAAAAGFPFSFPPSVRVKCTQDIVLPEYLMHTHWGILPDGLKADLLSHSLSPSLCSQMTSLCSSRSKKLLQ